MFQDEITSGIISSITQFQKSHGAVEALKVAELFLRAIYLYDEGVPMATALLAASALNIDKDKKSITKMLGFATICVSSVLPYLYN